MSAKPQGFDTIVLYGLARQRGADHRAGPRRQHHRQAPHAQVTLLPAAGSEA